MPRRRGQALSTEPARMATVHRVGVLTFHRCINYGSYWQARALTDGLATSGLDAVLLDHHSSRVTWQEWRNLFQPVRPRRTARSDYPQYREKARKFFAAFEGLPLSPPFDLDAPEEAESYDAVVVGSDEVWNFSHPWYAAAPLFFGEGLRARRLVSYAASFGCHDAAYRLEEPWASRLRRFSALSVRDDNSQILVRDALGIDPALVLDPCLQFDAVCRREAGDSGEVIVYGHSFPDWMAAAARRWADMRGVRLVSLGYRNDWADAQWLSAGPEEFAQAMGAARGVITNFFHGCVFALVNGKPFACNLVDYRLHKVRALVKLAGVEARLLDEASAGQGFSQALDVPSGPVAAPILKGLRARSSAYLDRALH